MDHKNGLQQLFLRSTRGKSVALYGLSFSLGFAIGPLLTRLLYINEALPLIISALLSMAMWLLIFFVRNEKPDLEEDMIKSVSSLSRFKQTMQYAWIAFLPGLSYGFLESTLHGIFPVHGLRIGHDVNTLSLIIPCFAFDSIITQLPLGMLSDKVERRKVLLFVFPIGIICFTLAGIYEYSIIALFVFFTIAGMFVGSIFSLGIAYMTDLLPVSLLPAGNIMIGVWFSIGSILGPILAGSFFGIFPQVSFFYLIVTVLVIVFGIMFFKKEQLFDQVTS